MYWTLESRDVRHFTRSRVWSGWLVKAPTPRLMPPSGGLLTSPCFISGYRAQPMSLTTAWVVAPAFTSPWAAAYTYGQFTMNMPLSLWKADLASSSPAVDIAGGAAEDRARSPITLAAASPAGEAISGVAFLPSCTLVMICPPAEVTRALVHTM